MRGPLRSPAPPRDGAGELEVGVPLPHQKGSGVPGVDGAGCGAGAWAAFCSVSTTFAEALASRDLLGKRPVGTPLPAGHQLPFLSKASDSEPVIPHTRQPRSPTRCFPFKALGLASTLSRPSHSLVDPSRAVTRDSHSKCRPERQTFPFVLATLSSSVLFPHVFLPCISQE